MGKMALAAIMAALLSSIGAASYASAAPADKKLHPGRVVASADVIGYFLCGPVPDGPYPGHLEIVAVDTDTSTIEYPEDPQDDKISIALTLAGQTWTEEGALRLVVNSDSEAVIVIGRQLLLLHDGGNPGSRLTGEPLGGTVDWMTIGARQSTCGWVIYLTSGNINITAAK